MFLRNYSHLEIMVLNFLTKVSPFVLRLNQLTLTVIFFLEDSLQ